MGTLLHGRGVVIHYVHSTLFHYLIVVYCGVRWRTIVGERVLGWWVCLLGVVGVGCVVLVGTGWGWVWMLLLLQLLLQQQSPLSLLVVLFVFDPEFQTLLHLLEAVELFFVTPGHCSHLVTIPREFDVV
jgi:hypothetical protein